LSNGNLITILDTESWGNVCSKVLVSLLVSGVFRDEVEVFSADDEGTVHLGGNNSSGQDTTTDGDETSEWALLVYAKFLVSIAPCMKLLKSFVVTFRIIVARN
jgi:hypothetical protein